MFFMEENILNPKQYIIFLLFTVFAISCAEQNPKENQNGSENYIVVLKSDEVQLQSRNLSSRQSISKREVVKTMMSDLASQHQLEPAKLVYSTVLEGGVYSLNAEQLEKLSQDPRVDFIEKDQKISINATQNGAVWGLDRIDQVSLPLSQSYNYPLGGSQVNVYVIDTGIQTTHQQFQGRAFTGADLVDNDNNATDCNGHGTHVAGTIAGSTYGVAKNARLYAVRVLDCEGSGSFSGVIAGVEWVTQHHVSPAVANMSLGGGISNALDNAVRASIQSGVTYALAAGNDNEPACNSSPSRVSTAIVVGSTTSSDSRSSFSNFGSCVSIFAPGSQITSSWIGSNTAINTIDGTSMASPHVAGVAALYLAQNPWATPAQVKSALLSAAVSGRVANAGSGSPNLLVNTQFLGAGDGGRGDEPAPEPEPEQPDEQILENNSALENLSASRGEEKYFAINIPADVSSLTVEISGGNGDADLFVKSGIKPEANSYDCRPYKKGNVEKCEIHAPAAGKMYVMIRAYDDFSQVKLRASYQVGAAKAPCVDCDRFSGSLNKKGLAIYLPEPSYQVGSGMQRYWLQGPAGTDFDIYLYKQNGSTWTQVSSSVKTGSLEQISYQGSAGVYRLKVISYSGAGTYEFYRQLP